MKNIFFGGQRSCTTLFVTFSVGAWVRVRKLDRSTEYINYQPSPEYSCTDFNTKVLSVRPLVRWSVGPSVGQKLSRIYTYALPQY